MESLMQWALQWLEGGNWLAFCGALVTLAMFKARRVLEDFDWHRSRRIRFLQSSLDCSVLDNASRQLIEEELRRLLVARSCGRVIEAPIRQAIVRLNEIEGSRLTLPQLITASRFLRLDKRGLPAIVIPVVEKIEHAMNVFFVVLLMAFLAAVVLLFLLGLPDIGKALKLLAFVAAIGGALAVITAQAEPYMMATRIEACVASAASKMIEAQAETSGEMDATSANIHAAPIRAA